MPCVVSPATSFALRKSKQPVPLAVAASFTWAKSLWHFSSLVWQRCVLHVCWRESLDLSHGAAVPCASRSTLRREKLQPPLHWALHAVYLVQFEYSQSTGQTCVLHAADCSSAAQALPPWRAHWSALRVRFLRPPSQLRLQLSQAPQAPSLQSIGHGLFLHELVSARNGQMRPMPCVSVVPWLTTLRVRFMTPPPHLRVHEPQEPQAPTSQLIGQMPRLQGVVSPSLWPAQVLPPNMGSVLTARLRCLKPALQVAEQSLHVPHAASSQCTGHSPRWQVCFTVRAWPWASQERPPNAACTAGTRLRWRLPQPHVTLHELQAARCHAWATQLTGQWCVLHALSSTCAPQALPLLRGCTCTRRVR